MQNQEMRGRPPGLTCRKDRPSDALKGSSACCSHPSAGRAAAAGPGLGPGLELSRSRRTCSPRRRRREAADGRGGVRPGREAPPDLRAPLTWS